MANQKCRFMFDPCILLRRFGPEMDTVALAERLGTDRTAVYRWLGGGIHWDPWQADRYAIRLGMHPAEVWGQQWWDECERSQAIADRRYAAKQARRVRNREASRG